MSTTDLTDELARERESLGIPADGNVNGRSIADRLDDEPDLPVEDVEEEEEALFTFVEQGRRVTLQQLIARNTPIEYSLNLSSKSFTGGTSMGLLPFSNPDVILVVPARQGKVAIDPTYDESGLVTKVSIRANFKPQGAHDAASREGRALLG